MTLLGFGVTVHVTLGGYAENAVTDVRAGGDDLNKRRRRKWQHLYQVAGNASAEGPTRCA